MSQSPLHFDEARAVVLSETRAVRPAPPSEMVPLEQAGGRVLAADVAADRDYPPFPRAARDGFAVRSADIADPPARLRVIGETRAGEPSRFHVGPGEAVEIMTGAPAPPGADCVVMVERTRREGDLVAVEEALPSGRNIVPQGSESPASAVVLRGGLRLEYPQIALLAAVGRSEVPVFRRPRVAILSTGDEVVDVERTPEPFQIRNSNAWSLAAQLRRRGAQPLILPVAPDRLDKTRDLISRGLEADLLLLSGGVSMGKHDLVERALAELGAEFFFTGVRIQPGKPLVFGRVGEKLFFGLPGNPVSTMVTFEVFARIAVDLLAGRSESPLPFLEARLATEFRHKPVLTRFLPARLEGAYDEVRVAPVEWQGSGDLAAVAAAHCFLVARHDRESWAAGERISILPR